jgi:hypothetical protein
MSLPLVKKIRGVGCANKLKCHDFITWHKNSIVIGGKSNQIWSVIRVTDQLNLQFKNF